MTFARRIEKLVFGTALVCMLGGQAHAGPPDWEWIVQLGSNGTDQVFDAAPDGAGGIVFTGLTNGNFAVINKGHFDAIGGDVDGDGNTVCTIQFGTVADDSCEAVSISDSLGILKFLFLGGTAGNWDGNNAGPFDYMYLETDDMCTEVCRDQVGTGLNEGFLGVDCVERNCAAVGFQGTNASLVGWSRGRGCPQSGWGVQASSSGTDVFNDVESLPPSSAVVTGSSTGNLYRNNQGSADIVIAEYNSDGSTNWDLQIGTPFADHGSRLIVDDVTSDIFVVGDTLGSLFDTNQGSTDAVVIKISPTGDVIWGVQFGTDRSDIPHAITTDGSGGVLVAGETRGNLGGMNAGARDAFVVHVDGDGNIGLVRQFGTGGSEVIYGIVLGNTEGVGGHFLVAGSTTGSLGGPNAGSWDVFVAKFPINPCPADLDGSGDVGVKDLLVLLGDWGPCKNCPADFDGSGDVGVKDLLVLLGAWGPCP